MPGHDIVVVGASAGGVEALVDLARSVPPDLPAAMFVVLHVPSTGSSALPEILSRQGSLPAAHVKDGEPIELGRIYVAPPDHHLLLRTGHVHLARGPRENGHRPAVDPLFRSAAGEYATRVIGVVLSGALDDGTAGLVAVKGRGGLAVVQEPADALYPAMPGSAIEHVRVDHVLPAAAMGPLLARLTLEPAAEAARLRRELLLDRANFATAWPLVGDRHGTASSPSELTGG
jgi:two-component system, chemotaxis family, protein-glutamate methylesterase/glutaminase